MIEGAITKYDTPWKVVPIDGTDPDAAYGKFGVEDAEGYTICETNEREVAEAITELPNFFYRLKAIAECKPAVLCRVWEGTEVTCPSCENLIRGGKEIMRRIGVEI